MPLGEVPKKFQMVSISSQPALAKMKKKKAIVRTNAFESVKHGFLSIPKGVGWVWLYYPCNYYVLLHYRANAYGKL